MEISFELVCALLGAFYVFIICTLLYCIHIYMYNFYPNKSNQKSNLNICFYPGLIYF